MKISSFAGKDRQDERHNFVALHTNESLVNICYLHIYSRNNKSLPHLVFVAYQRIIKVIHFSLQISCKRAARFSVGL